MANEAVIVIAILALLFFLLFFKLIGKSMKWIFKLLIHAISGFIVLFLVNVVGGIIGIQLDLSLINAIVPEKNRCRPCCLRSGKKDTGHSGQHLYRGKGAKIIQDCNFIDPKMHINEKDSSQT